MPTYDFIKLTPTGQLNRHTKVPYFNLPKKERGAPASTWSIHQPRVVSSDVSSVVVNQTPASYTSPKTYLWSTSKFAYGGVPTSNGSASYGYNQIAGGSGSTPMTPWTIETMVYGTSVSFLVTGVSGSDYRVLVDGAPVQANWSTWPSNADYRIHLTFSSAKLRTVKLILGAAQAFSSATVPGAGDLFYPPAPGAAVALIGDSYVSGTGANNTEGNISAGCMTGELALAFGWRPFALGQFGTGYVNNGGGTNGRAAYGHSSRMNALAALPSLDLILVFSSRNDLPLTTYSAASTATVAQAYWGTVKATRPDTPLVVVGPPSTGANTDLDTLNTALRNTANNTDWIEGYIDQRTDPWVTGTGLLSPTNGTGSADFFAASDGFHLSRAGFAQAADRVGSALSSARG